MEDRTAMTRSALDPKSPGGPPEDDRSAGVSLATLVVVAVALLPSTAILAAWALIIVTRNLDVAFALGVSDTFVNGVVVAASGLVTGTVVALVGGARRWWLVVPPAVGVIVGLGILLGFVGFAWGEGTDVGGLGLVVVAIGQVIAIVVSTRVTFHTVVGVAGAAIGLGMLVAGVVQAIPEPPAEVLLVLDVYTVDGTTGKCSGADEVAGVVEGSEVLLLEYHEVSGRPTELGSISLLAGVEGRGGCMFELGNPLGRPASGYENIDFIPESEPMVPYGVTLEGKRVIITMFGSES